MQWEDGIGGYLRVVRGGADVLLAAPMNGDARSEEDWMGIASYRNHE
jgi:hypothetical protein